MYIYYLKRWEYQNMLPASWEICMQVKKQHLEPGMEQWAGSKLGKEHIKAVLSPCWFNLHAEYIMWDAGLDDSQAGVRIAGRNVNKLRYADDTTLMAESEEELKSLLMTVKGEWKSWLQTQHSKNEDLGIWSHHFMANRWVNSGNSDRLYFLGLQNHCGWWLQPWNYKALAPWKKSYDKSRQCIKKQRRHCWQRSV